MNKWVGGFGFLVLITVVTIGFQNCSPFTAGELAREGEIGDDVIQNASLAWSTKREAPYYDSIDRVSRWMDLSGKGIGLYPPLRASGGLNQDLAPQKKSELGVEWVSLNEGTALSPLSPDFRELTSGEYTVLVVIRDLEFKNGEVNRIFLLNSPVDPVGALYGDMRREGSEALITVGTFFGAGLAVSRTIRLPDSQIKDPIAIAVRFAADPLNMQVAVNGKLDSSPLAIEGSPPMTGLSVRALTIHAAPGVYGFSGGFSLGEFAVYLTAMDDSALAFTSGVLNARWNRSITPPTPTPTPTPPPGVSSSGATLYARHCASCHDPINVSKKRGATLDRLNSSITGVPEMSGLTFLSASDRQKIVDALR